MSDAALDGVERWAAQWWPVARRWLDGHPMVIDVAIAAVAGISILGSSAVRSAGMPASALVILAAGALALRRRWPLIVFCVTLGATGAYLLMGMQLGPIVQLPGFALYTVAAWRPSRVSVPAGLVAIAAGCGMAGATPGGQIAWLAIGGWLLLPWLLGFVVRGYRRVREQIAAAQRRQAGYEERLAIAREVHDVVGHSLSVISMQSGVALHVLAGRPEDVEPALRAIRSVSGEALRELRATLAADPVRLRGLDDVADLAAASEGGGLAVRVDIDGQRGLVPPAVDHAGFRIVQEALTNVVRHARAETATVEIAYARRCVRITVTDDGVGPWDGDDTTGRGLAGMAHRAQSLGGSLRAGPVEDSGFVVHAELPWEEQ